jgi:hypothetical protein
MSVADKIDGNSSRIYGTIPVLTKECPWTRSGHLKLAHRLTFKCFGVCFNLFANQAELMRDASAYLLLECEPCSSSSATPRYSLVRRTDSQETSYQLYRNERRLFAGGDRRDLLERFGSTISLDVAEASPLRTFVHAGIVAWGKAAVLIPGRSFSGKTTLVAELARAGATYYSDEFAVAVSSPPAPSFETRTRAGVAHIFSTLKAKPRTECKRSFAKPTWA